MLDHQEMLVSFEPTSINQEHFTLSNSNIIRAYQLSEEGRVLVLGCGECREIPIKYLTRNSNVELLDIDTNALDKLTLYLEAEGRNLSELTFLNKDLTGLMCSICEDLRQSLQSASNASTALDSLINFADSKKMTFWYPAEKHKYTLIISSLLLTQLHVFVLAEIESVFLEYFPYSAEMLYNNHVWSKAKFNFARRLENRFVVHLKHLAMLNAIIYFSATVRVCFVKRLSTGLYSTEGSWIVAKTNRLADYFDSSFKILNESSWRWYIPKIEGNTDGRLYDVQALVLKYEG